MEPSIADAVILACEELLTNFPSNLFPLNAFQGGAGTSTHMNVNEVIAYYAQNYIDQPVDPLDHVNKYQSTNDVYPTALRISCIQWIRRLSEEAAHKIDQKLKNSFANIVKILKEEKTDVIGLNELFMKNNRKEYMRYLDQNISAEDFIENVVFKLKLILEAD